MFWLVQNYALGEWTAIAGFDVELDLLSFNEGLATFALNLRVVNKNVRLAIASNEAPTLFVIEPLNGSYSHWGLLVSLQPTCAGSGGNHNGNLIGNATWYLSPIPMKFTVV